MKDGGHVRFALSIERSITGPLALAKGGGALSIKRSIISGAKKLRAIDGDGFETDLDDVTLFGIVGVRRLEATGAIFTDVVTAIDRQAGCVRYSSVAVGSSTPHRFRCQPDLAIAARARLLKLDALPAAQADAAAIGVAPLFLDTDPDEPTFGLISSRCAMEIRAGGENGKEMGAFGATGEPMRFANITRLFDDYLPAALEGAIGDDTRNSASALRRNVP